MSSKIPVPRFRIGKYQSSKGDAKKSMEESKYEKLLEEFENYKLDKERELLSLEEELETLERELEVAQMNNPNLLEEGSSDLDRLEHLQQELDRFVASEAELRDQIDSLTTENDQLKAELDDQIKELSELKDLVADYESGQSNSEDALTSDSESGIKLVQSELETVKLELDSTKKELNEAMMQITVLEQECDEHMEELNKSSEEMNMLKSTNASLEIKIGEKDEKIEKLQRKLSENSMEVEQLRQRIKDLEAANLERKEERNLNSSDSVESDVVLETRTVLNSQTGEFESKILAEQNSKLSKEVDEKAKLLTEATEELQLSQLQCEKLAKEVEDLKRTCKDLKNVNTEKMDSWKKGLNDSLSKYNMVVEEKEQVEFRCEQLKAELDLLKLSLEEKEKKLSAVKRQRQQNELERGSAKVFQPDGETTGLLERINEENIDYSQQMIVKELELQCVKQLMAEREREISHLKALLTKPMPGVKLEEFGQFHEQQLENLRLLKMRNEEKREAEHRISDLLSDKTTLELRVTYLTRELEEKNRNIENLSSQISQSRKNARVTSDLQLTVKQLRSKINQLEWELSSVKNENLGLKASLEAARNEVEERELELVEKEATMNSKEHEIECLTIELDHARFKWKSSSQYTAVHDLYPFAWNHGLSESVGVSDYYQHLDGGLSASSQFVSSSK